MKYCIITFGCQMNEADSDLMASLLGRAGWQACEAYEEADLVVLNTCSVRERPEHKVFSLLGEMRPWKQSHPGAVLAVSGCMAQRAAQEIVRRAPHVDIVMGTGAFHRVEEYFERAREGRRPVVALDMDEDPSAARARQPYVGAQHAVPLRAFVPVIRGCSNFCSYCIVPYVRGPEASRSPSEIRREVESLVARGTREVTLLGQNVLAYGRDLARVPQASACTFPQLLLDLSRIEGLWRIRFTTCHPRDVDPGVISAMAEIDKVCEHIHLPIQAGTDRLLREMNRGYTADRYLEVVGELRARVPGIAITTDIMVGFPGESEDDFEKSLRLYEKIRFDGAFMFAYSPRPGTKAAALDNQLPRSVRLERLARVIEMQNRITIEKNEAAVGEEVELLVDGPAARGEGLLAGRARNNKQVIFPALGSGFVKPAAGFTNPAPSPSLPGSLVTVRLTEAHLWGFSGELDAGELPEASKPAPLF
jgi:tRNA-2-methylthio-N6-dimethylallyladenosine synthase